MSTGTVLMALGLTLVAGMMVMALNLLLFA